jgi:hypothetical protein
LLIQQGFANIPVAFKFGVMVKGDIVVFEHTIKPVQRQRDSMTLWEKFFFMGFIRSFTSSKLSHCEYYSRIYFKLVVCWKTGAKKEKIKTKKTLENR